MPTSTDTADAGAAIQLDPASSDGLVLIFAANPATQSIGRITFASSTDTGDFFVEIHTNDDELNPTDFPADGDDGCLNWAGIDGSATTRAIDVHGRISGDLTDTIENVEDIVFLYVEGDVDAAVQSNHCHNFWMEGTTTDSSFTFDVHVRQFQVREGGSLLGDFTAADPGNTSSLPVSHLIGVQDVSSPGDFGSSGVDIDVTITDGDLQVIRASGDFYANLTVMNGASESVVHLLDLDGSLYGRLEFT